MAFSAVYKLMKYPRDYCIVLPILTHSLKPNNLEKVSTPTCLTILASKKSPWQEWVIYTLRGKFILMRIGLRKSWNCHLEGTSQVGPLPNYGLDSQIEHPQIPWRSQSCNGWLHKSRITYEGARRTGCLSLRGRFNGGAEPDGTYRCGREGWCQENHSFRVSVRVLLFRLVVCFEDWFFIARWTSETIQFGCRKKMKKNQKMNLYWFPSQIRLQSSQSTC